MTIRIKGKKMITIWSVDDHKKFNDDGTYIFTDRPQLKSESKVDSWIDICSFEGNSIPHNSMNNLFGGWNCHYAINISENESVKVEREIFRADLNEIHAFTDKVVGESTEDKSSSEKEYDNVMKEFNKTMIEADDKLSAYCKLHKLNPEDTDCIELFKLVYDVSSYTITNGRIKHVEVSSIQFVNSSSINTITNHDSIYKIIDSFIGSCDGTTATSASCSCEP